MCAGICFPEPLSITQKKISDAVSDRPACVHSQTERQQRQQGLFGGASCKLRQCLDHFVHHHAKVALQLLPPLLHKLGILKTEKERDKQSEEGRTS